MGPYGEVRRGNCVAVPEVFEQMIPHALTPSERGSADTDRIDDSDPDNH